MPARIAFLALPGCRSGGARVALIAPRRTCCGTLELPNPMAGRVKAQGAAVGAVLDFIFRLRVRDGPVACGAQAPRAVTGNDLLRTYEREPPLPDAFANTQPQRGISPL